MGQFGIGLRVKRKEDDYLLVGAGRYMDDINFAGQAYAYVVRSPHANARILSIDTSTATKMPGVVAAFTGVDVANIGPLPCAADGIFEFKRRDGSKRFFPTHHVLARQFVRHVGDPVVMIVAETYNESRDAAEAVIVDYETLDCITDTQTAAKPSAPVAYASEGAKDNQAFVFSQGDEKQVQDIFDTAEHIVSFRHINQRLVCNSMEPRSCIGIYDLDKDRYNLYTNTQSVYRNRQTCATQLGITEDQLHVVCPEVGGSFGMKGMPYPEQPLVLWAAKQLRRPVKWNSNRSEAFVSDTQGRDLVTDAELAMDGQGRFRGLRVRSVGNMGAYASNFGPMILAMGSTRPLPGCYNIPSVFAEVEVVITNKVFTDAYRGAGRPEASYVIERLVDIAGRKLGLDAAEIRRRNLISSGQMPFTGPTGLTYDSGNFIGNLDDCILKADWAGFTARKQNSEDNGLRRGRGLSTYIEATAGGVAETSRIVVSAQGDIIVHTGTLAQGQAHITTFAQIVSDKLGISYDSIIVKQGDSDVLPNGGGSGGSRSVYSAGGAILVGVEKILDKARKIASHSLEVSEADLIYKDGVFTISGTDRKLGLADIAKAAEDPNNLPAGMSPDLDEIGKYASDGSTFPNGCHIVEVEVDPETGAVHIDRYTVVDDFGVVINPMIVEGQVHGGIAQGIGQALYEDTVYDEAGQLITGSFMDYTMPRADNIPSILVSMNEVPCKTNSLGAKGAGEAGTTGSTGAVINALIDALAPLGVEHIEMPATPERVWKAIQEAEPTTQ